MAKRKRLGPAALTDLPAPAPETKSAYPPIAGVAGDAAMANAVMELGAKISTARQEGRWIDRLPLDAIAEDYLIRDRIPVQDDEMIALRDSLRRKGQQMAIEVTSIGEDRYGLISGWRRLMALREIQTLYGEVDTVLALVRPPDEAPAIYEAMVTENEIRAGLSFYERARIVVRAADANVYADDAAALAGLFADVPKARRSKIKTFTRLVRALDGDLRFPTAISEKLGLALAKIVDTDPAPIQAALRRANADAPSEEIAALQQALTAAETVTVDVTPPPKLDLQITKDGPTRVVVDGEALADQAVLKRLIKAIERL